MEKEKYYLVEKVKNIFMIDAFNLNIIKQTSKNLEMISSKVIKPDEIGVKLIDGKIICDDKDYKIKEINEKKAIKILKFKDENYSSWQDYMSNSEDIGSSHLGSGGDNLY